MTEESRWELDKKIPVALVAVVIAQTFALGFLAASFNGRVTDLEKTSASLQATMKDQGKDSKDLGERMSKIEIGVGYMSKQIDSISDKLDKRWEKR